jgi:hypothetical protein
MEFSKLQNEVAALLASAVTKQMSAEEFAAYAGEQVQKAADEAAGGHQDRATARLTALQGQVEAITKFEFKPGELPSVTIYKDPWQTTHATVSTPSGDTASGSQHWIAKAANFRNVLTAALDKLAPAGAAPTSGEVPPAPAASDDDFEWPIDLAKADKGEEQITF